MSVLTTARPEAMRGVPPAQPRFYVADTGGCGWYRGVLPARAVGGVVRYAETLLAFLADVAALPSGTTVVVQRPLWPDAARVVAALRERGCRVLVDIDDDFWSLDWRNPAHRVIPPEARRACAAALKAADGVLVSTAPLAARVARWQRRVTVLPNALDPGDFVAYGQRPASDVVRVGWAGSYTHHHDLRPVLPYLLAVGRLPGVELHLFGYDPFQRPRSGGQTAGTYTVQGTRYTFHGWSADLRQHYWRIGALDVALAPLLDTPFNASKSAIKWLEHAFYATAMVLSDARPYRDAVRHGETGFLARTPAEFGKYLKLLVTNAGLRREIGAAARAEVLSKHLLVHRAALWKEALAT